MNISTAFNATADFLLARLWLVKVAAVALVLLGFGLWLHHHDADIRTTERLDAKLHAVMHTDTVLVERKAQVAAKLDTLTRTVTRTTHRVDTLWAAVPETLTTRADTVKALDALPVLRLSTDSAIKACSDFQLTCAAYRHVTDSLITVLRDQNDIVRRHLGIERPGKLSVVREWAIRAGIAFLSFKVGQRLAR